VLFSILKGVVPERVTEFSPIEILASDMRMTFSPLPMRSGNGAELKGESPQYRSVPLTVNEFDERLQVFE
jgi:hypothetical protein